MGNWLKRHGAFIAGSIGAGFLLFMLGLGLGVLRIQPAGLMDTVLEELRDLKANWQAYFSTTPSTHLRPRKFAGNGVVLSDQERMEPGVTFVSGLFGDVLGFRLYAADGQLLREWPINFFDIAPEEMTYRFHALIHGAHLYENGDVVANLDGRGMVRANACGEVIWRNNDESHHSVWVDEQNSIWAPVHMEVENDRRFAGIPFNLDGVAKFDPDTGTKTLEINLFEMLRDSDNLGLIQKSPSRMDDITHLNDVEILSQEMASAFPLFDAGDILLSSRNLHQIWVLDGVEHTLKWWFAGPMKGQHDPDFQPDGTITLFDNRPSPQADTGEIGRGSGSRILKIDPVMGRSWTIYESDANNTFYTPYRGKHQVLENGNILITETDRGRVFEVAPDGTVVWTLINGWDETHVAWVMGAARFPESYSAISNIECK